MRAGPPLIIIWLLRSGVAAAAPNGSHYAHASSGYAGGPQYACSVCHSGYSATTVSTTTHVNKQVDLGFTGNGAGTSYSKAAPIAPGTAWGTCSTSNCHGAGNPTWGNNTTKARCEKCHGYRSSGWSALNGASATTDAKAGTHFNHISSAGAVKFTKPLKRAIVVRSVQRAFTRCRTKMPGSEL